MATKKPKKTPNARVFFDVNFEKEIIKEYIISEIKNNPDHDDRPRDEQIESLFAGLINRITEECIPDLKRLYIDPDYKYVQIKMVGLKEEPKDHRIYVEVGEDSINITAKE